MGTVRTDDGPRLLGDSGGDETAGGDRQRPTSKATDPDCARGRCWRVCLLAESDTADRTGIFKLVSWNYSAHRKVRPVDRFAVDPAGSSRVRTLLRRPVRNSPLVVAGRRLPPQTLPDRIG